MNKYEYYLIHKKQLVRTHKEGELSVAEKFINGKWKEVDYYEEVFFRLNGFDSSEEDWMYGIGSTNVMDTIEEISKEQAQRIINKH